MKPNSVFHTIFKTNENMLLNIFFSSLLFNIKIEKRQIKEKTENKEYK